VCLHCVEMQLDLVSAHHEELSHIVLPYRLLHTPLSIHATLQIQFPDIGGLWYLLTLVSPYAGIYYWQNASRKDKAQVSSIYIMLRAYTYSTKKTLFAVSLCCNCSIYLQGRRHHIVVACSVHQIGAHCAVKSSYNVRAYCLVIAQS
jgi:Cofactor assembly of complex C subunit B